MSALLARLDRLALTVRSQQRSAELYCTALGFTAGDRGFLHRGAQRLELREAAPDAALYPEPRHSNDQWFAHCALVTADIAADVARLRAHPFTPVSRAGPQLLPGGITAFKFRDPDGHPLELIQFPHPDPRTAGGIDHCAIVVADVARSVAFYTALGLVKTARQLNKGPAQEALDDLDGVRVEVVAMMPSVAAPHLELLGYRAPPGAQGALALSARVFSGAPVGVMTDPDGHLFEVE